MFYIPTVLGSRLIQSQPILGNGLRTEISFTYPNCFACAVNNLYGTKVRFVRRDIKKGLVCDMVELYNEERNKLDEAIKFLASYSHISECDVLERSKSGNMAKVAISVKENGCPINLVIKEFSIASRLPSFERVDFNGKIHWRLEAKGGRKLARLERALKTKFGVRDFLAKRLGNRVSMSKSNFLLKEAFERGYFDVPKGTSIEELSHQLGVPLSTLDVDIRRALKNVLAESTC